MKTLFTAVVLCLVFGSLTFAKGKADGEIKFERVGAGIVVGDPLGISVKLWNNKETAFDGVLSLGQTRTLYVHADYLLHNYELLRDLSKELNSGDLVFYYGGGAYISFWTTNSMGLGARLPVGVEYLVNPFDLYIEVAPALAITPAMGLTFYGGLGVRFDF